MGVPHIKSCVSEGIIGRACAVFQAKSDKEAKEGSFYRFLTYFRLFCGAYTFVFFSAKTAVGIIGRA